MQEGIGGAAADNKEKRVVIYSPFFYPEPISTGKYNTYLARAIAKAGGRVEVVASHPLYPSWTPQPSSDNPTGIVVHRGGRFIRYPRRDIARRLVLEAWYTLHSIVATWRYGRSWDIAVFVFPPVLFSVAARFMLPSHCRMVGIVHDLQGLMMGSGVVAGKGFIGKVVLGLEAYVLRRCDQVVCLSKSMADVVIKQLGVDGKKCQVCYPFAVPQCAGSGSALADLFDEELIHIVYSGALGEKQMPLFLLEVFESVCEARSDIVCHIFSRGARFDELNDKRKESLANRVVFHDLVPEEQLEELYQRSDLQVIPQAPGTGAAAFPSKLPSLLMAGVPVMSVCETDCELAQITTLCGGMAVPPDDAATVARHVVAYSEEATRVTHAQRREKAKDQVAQLFNAEKLVDVILGEEGSARR